jgi:uncharacterized protein
MPDSVGKHSRRRVSTQPKPITMAMMPAAIPSAIHGQKYISLTTFRKTGVGVSTPVWFGEEGDKLYVMTRSDMGKAKRIRNNPRVRVAPCTVRGRVTGPEFEASARILPPEAHAQARQAINRKYWAARLPLIWYRTDTYIELTFP